jgi:hypothetical protein
MELVYGKGAPRPGAATSTTLIRHVGIHTTATAAHTAWRFRLRTSACGVSLTSKDCMLPFTTAQSGTGAVRAKSGKTPTSTQEFPYAADALYGEEPER